MEGHEALRKEEFEAVIRRGVWTKRDFFRNSKATLTKLPQKREQMIPLTYPDNLVIKTLVP